MPNLKTVNSNSHQRIEHVTETLRRAKHMVDQAKETIKRSKETVQVSRKIQSDRQRQQREKTNNRRHDGAAAKDKGLKRGRAKQPADTPVI